jgi:uncharacterized membrane protein
MSRRLPWALVAAVVLAQVAYPLTEGATRDRLTVVTVLLGCALSVTHALSTRGPRAAFALMATTTGGGLAVEVVGVHTGLPFGEYAYSDRLGPRLLGVPLVVPLAWTWMAWPAWLAAVRLTASPVWRVAVATVALAAWDVFLDPQMVAAGQWVWHTPIPTLPGVTGVPIGNYLGWLVVSAAMMGALGWSRAAGHAEPADRPMHVFYLWTYGASVLAHAVFLDLPGSAFWGGLAMAPVALPLAATTLRRGADQRPVSPRSHARRGLAGRVR